MACADMPPSLSLYTILSLRFGLPASFAREMDGLPFAVFVFFVLSGYVLAGGSASSSRYLSKQVVARYIRLGIPASFSILLAYLLLKSGMSNMAEAFSQNGNAWLVERFPVAGYPWWKAAANIAGSYFFTASSSLNQVLWTMRTEFFGSITIFAVSWWLTSAVLRSYAYLVLVAFALAFSSFIDALYFVPFFAGALMREAGFQERRTGRLGIWVLFLVGLLLGGTPYGNATGSLYEPLVFAVGSLHPYPLEVLKIVGALVLVASTVWLKVGFFETRLSEWLGRISFSSYLIHMLVLVSLTSYVFGEIGQKYLAFQAAIYLVTVLALASAFHRFVEAPSIAWSQRIKTQGRWSIR